MVMPFKVLITMFLTVNTLLPIEISSQEQGIQEVSRMAIQDALKIVKEKQTKVTLYDTYSEELELLF